jgi:hypothetical protein
MCHTLRLTTHLGTANHWTGWVKKSGGLISKAPRTSHNLFGAAHTAQMIVELNIQRKHQ